MAHDEASFLDGVREQFRITHPSGFWFKVHGGPYQAAGIPDVLCATGAAVAGVEFKWAAKPAQLDKPPADALLALLSPQQRATCVALARLRGPLMPRLLLGAELAHDGFPGGRADYAFACDYAALAALPADKTLLDIVGWDVGAWAQVNDGPTPQWVHDFDAHSTRQIRSRGETWAVDALLFDARRWACPTPVTHGDIL